MASVSRMVAPSDVCVEDGGARNECIDNSGFERRQYGKTIDNVFDRDIAKICRKKEHLLQHVTRGNYKRHVIINEDLVVVFLRQNFVYFNKPYYIGMIQI